MLVYIVFPGWVTFPYLGTRNDVIVQKEFVADLENAATKANQEILFSKVAQQIGHFDNQWLLFSKYIDAVNEKCTQIYYQSGKADLVEQGYS